MNFRPDFVKNKRGTHTTKRRGVAFWKDLVDIYLHRIIAWCLFAHSLCPAVDYCQIGNSSEGVCVIFPRYIVHTVRIMNDVYNSNRMYVRHK